MKSIIFVTLFLIAPLALAQAPFSGQWKGTAGDFTMYVNEVEQGKAKCKAFEFDIVQDKDLMSLNTVYAHCGYAFEVEYAMGNMLIQGSDLVWEKKKVGTLNGSSMHLDISEEKRRLVADFKVVGETMDYSYTWTDGLTILVIHGKLKKVK